MPRVTIRDVAQASGVSPSTVSFVLNNTPGQTISVATKQRVKNAAHELGYVPSGVARALRGGTSKIVVFGIGKMPGGPALDRLLSGARSELLDHGYELMVLAGADSLELKRVAAGVGARAAIDLMRSYLGSSVTDTATGQGLAAITHAQIAYIAGRGHHELAFALPEARNEFVSLRCKLTQQAARMVGVTKLVPLVQPSEPDGALRALKHLRRTHPEVTAVAAYDDLCALRVLTSMRSLGLHAPDDLAVVGFDNSEEGALWDPALTTLRSDEGESGARLARSALGISLKDLPPIPVTVVQRASA